MPEKVGSFDLGLAGRTALVTAASEGLGLGCAVELAAAGCRVVICGRRQEKLEAALASLNASQNGSVHAIQADLASPGAIEPLFHGAIERFGGLDILVVNSGHMAYGGL